MDLTARLDELLSGEVREHLGAIAGVARERGVRVYLVGGVVRDAVMGNAWRGTRPDVTVVAPIADFVAACARRIAGSRVRYVSAYGTARLDVGDVVVELASARRDRYDTPGSMPRVEAVDRIEADLPRRDFTVNAMAVELSGDGYGALIDPLDGAADCAGRVLRLTRVGCGSFADDPTRILRGVKLAARWGMRFEAATAGELRDALPGLTTLYETQPGRVWKEWRQYFDGRENLAGIFEVADEFGVLEALKLTWRADISKERLAFGASGAGSGSAVSRFGSTLACLRWDGILEMYDTMPLPKEWRRAVWDALDDASGSSHPQDSAEKLELMRLGLELIDGEIARRG